MKKILPYLLLLISLPVVGSPKVLVVGDSLSAGYGVTAEKRWVNLLAQKLKTQCSSADLINASVSGDTSSGGVTRLRPLLKRHNPDLVIIELGGNDGLRGINPKTMRTNLLHMAQLSQAQGAKVLLLGVKLPPNYGDEFVQSFHQVYFDVAEQASVPLVPFFLQGVALNAKLMQADGIHPNDQAQPILMQNVWAALVNMLADPEWGSGCELLSE